jgi:tetratricopeptide (TPR) repeat protein
MSVSLADIYFMKALDEYPYALEITVENLNYALSYDPDHVSANCLMGRLYMEQLTDYKMAEYYLQKALSIDPQNAETYIYYVQLCLMVNDLDKAGNIIDFAKNLEDIDRVNILYFEGLLYELRKEFLKAIHFLEKALLESYYDEGREIIKKAIERNQEKLDSLNPFNYVLV